MKVYTKLILTTVLTFQCVGCSLELYVKMDIQNDPFHPRFVLSRTKNFSTGWNRFIYFVEVGENGYTPPTMEAFVWRIRPTPHLKYGTPPKKDEAGGQVITYGTLPVGWEGYPEKSDGTAKPLELCAFYAIQSAGQWFFLIGKKDGRYYSLLLNDYDFYHSDFRKTRTECMANTGLIK